MTLNLFYSWNTAIETVGVIFVNTGILDWSTEPSTHVPYHEGGMKASDRGKLARRLFENFGVKNVVIHTDLSKAQMIEKLDELQKKADNFKSEEGKVLGIFLLSISYAMLTEM